MKISHLFSVAAVDPYAGSDERTGTLMMNIMPVMREVQYFMARLTLELSGGVAVRLDDWLEPKFTDPHVTHINAVTLKPSMRLTRPIGNDRLCMRRNGILRAQE